MKKLFFASALVAGLGMMASCSSDDVVATAPGAGAGAGDNGLVPVELTVGGPTVSVQKRGHGTVGDLASDAENNKWHKEQLRLLMMERSVADGNAWGFTQWSYIPTTPPNTLVTVTNFANVAVTAPDGTAAGALDWSTESTPKYYPNTGIHDFFAYNIDDAATIYTEATDTEDPGFMLRDSVVGGRATMKYVWFKIDGSQDLMAGIATNDDAGTNVGFSAATAHAGVTPSIQMEHLLTRFTFGVKAAAASAEGITVTGISVKSKTTGKMIVAYDLGQGGVAPTKAQLISFEVPTDVAPDGVEEPVDLVLKDRGAITDAPVAVSDLTPVVLDAYQADGPYQAIGHALMVAPGEAEYEMTLTLTQDFNVPNAPDDPEGGSTTLTLPIKIPSATNAGVPDFTADETAQPGSSYAVNIKVYGMEEVKVEASLTGWNDGGSIEVDTNVGADTEEEPEELEVP